MTDGRAGAPVPCRVVLDTDGGIDDALAMLFLSGLRDARLEAIGTVAGNVDAAQAAENMLRLREACALPPVTTAVGCQRPLIEPGDAVAGFHGTDGLGDAGLPAAKGRPSGEHAVDQLLRLARASPGRYVLLTTGPLTNLATAVTIEPNLPGLLARVVVMGGSVAVAGNRAPVAEANIAHDPEAAAIVLGAGFDLTLVGLDVTMTTTLGPTDIARLESTSTVQAQVASGILAHYLLAYEEQLGGRSCPLHDPLAAGIAADPSLVLDTWEIGASVELHGRHTRGTTVVDRRFGGMAGGPTHIAKKVDGQRFVSQLLAVLTTPYPSAPDPGGAVLRSPVVDV